MVEKPLLRTFGFLVLLKQRRYYFHSSLSVSKITQILLARGLHDLDHRKDTKIKGKYPEFPNY